MDDTRIFKSEFHYQEHDGQLTHKLTQPDEDKILERNKQLRNNPGILRDLGQGSSGGTWGRQLASIPLIVWEQAIREGFDLTCRDKEIRERELNRFLRTPAGKACLVQG